MLRHITTFIILFFVSAINAQTQDKTLFIGDIFSDTTTLQSSYIDKAFTPLLKSENKIEIRFISYPAFELSNYLILTYNEDWSVKYYFRETETDSLSWTDLTQKTNIDSVFSLLVSNNIFSLPDHDSLKTVKYEYNTETNQINGSGTDVSDGIYYSIEFKVGNMYRRYGYSNPDVFAAFYPYDNQLRNFVNIVDLFNEFLKD